MGTPGVAGPPHQRTKEPLGVSRNNPEQQAAWLSEFWWLPPPARHFSAELQWWWRLFRRGWACHTNAQPASSDPACCHPEQEVSSSKRRSYEQNEIRMFNNCGRTFYSLNYLFCKWSHNVFELAGSIGHNQIVIYSMIYLNGLVAFQDWVIRWVIHWAQERPAPSSPRWCILHQLTPAPLTRGPLSWAGTTEPGATHWDSHAHNLTTARCPWWSPMAKTSGSTGVFLSAVDLHALPRGV